MQSLTKYFESLGSKHKYHMGDRVSGEYEGIPFVGSVAVDHQVYADAPRQVSVFLDLPIKVNDTYISIVTVPQSKLKLRKSTS